MTARDAATRFHAAVRRTAAALRERLPGQPPPQYYLHFGADYDLSRLFDAPAERFFLAQCSEWEGGANLDGEEPELRFGLCAGVPVVASCGGRRHAEGVGMAEVLFPTAVAEELGARSHIYVETAISLDPELKPGKWGMLTDFINGYAVSPLDGLHGLLDNPYPDFSEAFSQHQNSEIINALAEFGPPPRLCTFYGHPGFHACTRAEARLARAAGAEFIGHDLVLHLVFSHALGCRVSALLLAGAQMLPNGGARVTREEMRGTGHFCSPQLVNGLRKALAELGREVEMPELLAAPDDDVDEFLTASIKQCATRSSPLKAFLKRPEKD